MDQWDLIVIIVEAGISFYYYLKYNEVLNDNRDLTMFIETINAASISMYNKLSEDDKKEFSIHTVERNEW